ncbi:MAG: lactate utilization protein [Neomegalonema sp.]|nr:lactate utilization protein [Neomegalonema sp.]
MTAEPKSSQFKSAASEALQNPRLQAAMKASGGLAVRRAAAIAEIPEFEAIRDAGRDLKNHTLANLDAYLLAFEEKALESGAKVHWAADAEEARAIILKIVGRHAKGPEGKARVNKGKSMISEEIGLNSALEAAGHHVLETDLGEYIIQLRGEPPSHIIAPAAHVSKPDVEADFRAAHTHLDPERTFPDAASLVHEARHVLREQYFGADVGITGANMLIAETGQGVIVTNEGNGDLSQILPDVHIAVASLEKVIPTLDDASTILRLLARSATGQSLSSYTTFYKGARRQGDLDGPKEMHFVLLDNGRSEMLAGEFREMLRCIRCGACMNNCPVYRAVGGHSYGWVYVGPMGSVLTPNFVGIKEGRHLPNASTFCGRCQEVCPVRIPLPGLMRKLREAEFEQKLSPQTARYGLGVWRWFAKRPALYHRMSSIGMRALNWLSGGHGRLKRLPFGGGWTAHRDFPAPAKRTFMAEWKARKAAKSQGDDQ